MTISRRNVLKMGAGAAAICLAGPALEGADVKKKIPIGLQLYSVRTVAEKDLPGVLQQVGKMGYDGVEFAGYYGWDQKPKDLRKLLDDNALKCCGTHTALDTLQGDNFKRTVELHKTLGNKFLIVPYLPEEHFKTAEACRKTAGLFNELAAKAKEEGMFVGYHAHGGDFKKLGDETYWDIFFAATGPDVVAQLDTHNCITGGGDPYAELKKFVNKTRTLHIKEYSKTNPEAPIGKGDIKWDEIFRICDAAGATEWYIVEHESGNRPMQSVAECIANLRQMGK